VVDVEVADQDEVHAVRRDTLRREVGEQVTGRVALARRLAALPSPLLLVAGDADHVCPEAQLRDLGLRLPMAETEIVAGTDHFWQGYERDLQALVGPFFARTLLANEGA
jgi:pimeloyl-ACP methyl ester carboxylesterase